jgi:type I restriction enzyme S subunit
MSKQQVLGLPQGWYMAKFQDIVDSLQPGFACGKRDENGFVQLRMNNIGLEGKIITDSMLKVPKSETNLEKYRLKKDDVIFNNTNSTALVGKTALFDDEIEDCVFSNHLTRIRVNHELTLAKFVVNFLRLEQKRGTFELLCRRFVGQAAVPRESLLNLGFPLPPINEQKRIISKIEELFNESKTVRKVLDKSMSTMKRLRQFVLASAFRGKLVPQDPDDEPAKNRWGIKNIPLSDKDLPTIPSKWCYRKLREISERVSVGHVGPTSQYYCDKSLGIPFIRSQNVRPGKLDLEGIRYITVDFHNRLKKSQLLSGDLLIVRVGANRGDSCIVPNKIGDMNCANIVFARPFNGISEYLEFYFQSDYCQRKLIELTTGSAQGVINTKSVAEIPVPIPPLEEQIRIVNRIRETFSFADQIEKSVEEARKHVGNIDHAILTKAFHGDLVPQDPKDEPASILLERI